LQVEGVSQHSRVELLPGADAVKSTMLALGTPSSLLLSSLELSDTKVYEP